MKLTELQNALKEKLEAECQLLGTEVPSLSQ